MFGADEDKNYSQTPKEQKNIIADFNKKSLHRKYSEEEEEYDDDNYSGSSSSSRESFPVELINNL